MPSIFLIRHGEPELTGVVLGQFDAPLSMRGREQAAAATANLQVHRTYTSPLLRATQTAECIDSRELHIVEELREVDLGEWTGKSWTQIEEQWGDLARRKTADWLGIPAPGGETWESVMRRAEAALHIIRSGPDPCAVVAHQGINSALANLITGCDPLTFAQEYGEVIHLEYE